MFFFLFCDDLMETALAAVSWLVLESRSSSTFGGRFVVVFVSFAGSVIGLLALVQIVLGQWGSVVLGIDLDAIRPDFLLQEGDLSLGKLDMKVFHTPGHSPGSACLYLPEDKVLFSGDVVFKEGLI